MGASLNRSMRPYLNRCGEGTSLLREVHAAEEGLEAGVGAEGLLVAHGFCFHQSAQLTGTGGMPQFA